MKNLKKKLWCLNRLKTKPKQKTSQNPTLNRFRNTSAFSFKSDYLGDRCAGKQIARRPR